MAFYVHGIESRHPKKLFLGPVVFIIVPLSHFSAVTLPHHLKSPAVFITIFLAASSKTIAFVGVAIVMVMVIYGYSQDIKKKNRDRNRDVNK